MNAQVAQHKGAMTSWPKDVTTWEKLRPFIESRIKLFEGDEEQAVTHVSVHTSIQTDKEFSNWLATNGYSLGSVVTSYPHETWVGYDHRENSGARMRQLHVIEGKDLPMPKKLDEPRPEPKTQYKDVSRPRPVVSPPEPLKTGVVEVESSAIKSVQWDKDGFLMVVFKTGYTYMYANVPVGVYNQLITAESVGKFFNDRIKDAPAYKLEAEV